MKKVLFVVANVGFECDEFLIPYEAVEKCELCSENSFRTRR